MNIAHITQRLGPCHGTSCATHQGKGCDCGAAVDPVEEAWRDGWMSGMQEAQELLTDDIVCAERWRYIKSTTTAIRNSETGEREECTPDEFEASVDRLIAAAKMGE